MKSMVLTSLHCITFVMPGKSTTLKVPYNKTPFYWVQDTFHLLHIQSDDDTLTVKY